MKRISVFIFLGLLVSACHQPKTIKLHAAKPDSTSTNNSFIANKQYTDAELTEGLENGFVKTLTLNPKGENTYFVTFSSSPHPADQPKSCCRYKGWGTFRNDSIFVELINLKKAATLIISHGAEEAIQPELIVSTYKAEDVEVLKYFCCGEKTLAGKYVMKALIASDE